MQKNPAQSTHFSQQRKPKRSPILWRRGAIWLACLGPFFFLSYGLLNYFTATRNDVAVIVGEWEYAMPFVPWLMLPYMSIDAFYAALLFLYRKKKTARLPCKKAIAGYHHFADWFFVVSVAIFVCGTKSARL